ncbi:hypothetical protein RI138_15745 [Streptomyces sp. C11-1]|uniref:Integral membrane protein n=1 Tax=Streptomyces durocortorensis TaxID=2811104 RepID=A0ABY9VW45_9ACTN|nr:hypothetical protein [Streptomyces durocortorensis]WNF28166.1 hypothetical protein RI138_15745 [Streptomyces durocortorensis]
MSTPLARAGAGLRLMRAAVFTAVCVALSAAGHVLAAGSAVPAWTLLAGFLGVLAVAVALAGRERSLPSITGALASGQIALHAVFAYGSHGSAPAASATGGDNSLIRFAAGLVCGAGAGQLDAADAHRIVSTAGIDPATLTQGHGHLASAGGAAAATAAAGDGTSGIAAVCATVSALLPSLPMFVAHLLVALATGWLLRRGEIALFRLARLSAHSAQALAAGARLRSLRSALALVRALRAGSREQLTAGPRAVRSSDDAAPPAAGNPLQHLVIRRGPPAPYALAA